MYISSNLKSDKNLLTINESCRDRHRRKLEYDGTKIQNPEQIEEVLNMCFVQRAERKPQRNSQYKNIYIEREWIRNCAFIKKHKTIHIRNSKMEQNNKNR